MGDRFKFRFFDTEENIMINDEGVESFAIGDLLWDDSGRYINMQCSGLKDKSGNLIYEGDIIDVKGVKYNVVWDNDECGFSLHLIGTAEYHSIYCTSKSDIVKIGNIHENPELLVKD